MVTIPHNIETSHQQCGQNPDAPGAKEKDLTACAKGKPPLSAMWSMTHQANCTLAVNTLMHTIQFIIIPEEKKVFCYLWLNWKEELPGM